MIEYKTDKANILGTDYKIEIHKYSEDKYLRDNSWSGYTSDVNKLIVVADTAEKEVFVDYDTEEEAKRAADATMRHEIIHAYLNESGLKGSTNPTTGGWATNEEMVDWLAIQFEKIGNTFLQVGCIKSS